MVRGRFSNADIREVTELIGMGLEPPLDLSDPPRLRRWLHRADPDRLRSFGRIWMGKARLDQLRWGLGPAPVVDLLLRLRDQLRRRPPLRVEELALNGRDLIALGLKPSPRFGEILDHLMDEVLEDPNLNTRESLLELVELAQSGVEESQ
jgi:hypothetical protein